MNDGADARIVSPLEEEYTLLGELGRGGSAIVYRARDRVLMRDVAIKVVRPRFAGSEDEAIARLEREARTVARLQHPNIVTVHAVKRLAGGGVALVMQLVPGRTLKQAILDDGPFTPDRAEHVLRDIAEALAFAHAHGVVHRDVKPENVFLDSSTGRAMLSDFGIAHSKEFDVRLTMTGAAIGTPAYMAPEQIDGVSANARSDVYSLGLVAWEMLTGVRPWADEALYNVIYKQKHEDLPAIDALRPGQVPPRLQYIVERMLQKRPAARWAGADGLLVALTNWMQPGDWAQWEASHKRRRERAALEPAAAPLTKRSTEEPTVKFLRPDGQWDLEALGIRSAGDAGAGVAAADESDIEDEAPSWAVEAVDDEPVPVRRGVRVGPVVALLLVVASAGGAAATLRARQLGPFAPGGVLAAYGSTGRAIAEASPADVAPPVVASRRVPVPEQASGALADTAPNAQTASAAGAPLPADSSPAIPSRADSARLRAAGTPPSAPAIPASIPAATPPARPPAAPGAVSGASGAATAGAAVPVPVAARPVALRVAPGSLAVNPGEALRLSAVLLTDDGASLPATGVAWRSGNNDIVTVDARGRITGVAAGTTVVMARRGALSALSTITVRYPLVGQIELSTAEAVLQRGDALRLRATLRDAAGTAMAPRPLTWSSSNDDVAIVNANGVVVGIAPGVATITASVDAAIASTSVIVR